MSESVRLPYSGREEAGRVLASCVLHLKQRPHLLVLALPRGGVPVAHQVALALDAPLDVLVVRKLGHPSHEEYAIGAIAGDGIRVLNNEATYVKPADLERIVAREEAELQRREHAYRDGMPPAPIEGRAVILVDDGLATGSTMRAAARAVRQRRPAWTCIAVPVGAPDSCESLAAEVDELVCPAQPTPFQAVGAWYRDFPQTSDQEVCALLVAARANTRRDAVPGDRA